MTTVSQAGSLDRSMFNRVLVSSVVGTTIEWYDFFLYATASALVFAKLFFPSFDPVAGTIAAFGTFAVGYIARPFGAIFCGSPSCSGHKFVTRARRCRTNSPASSHRAPRP